MFTTVKTRVIFLILFLIVILISIIFLKNRSQNHETIQSIQQDTPTLQQVKDNSSINTFRLTSFNSSKGLVGITEPLLIEFNQPLSENIVYTIEPNILVKSEVGNNPYEFIIRPVNAWAFNTDYKLTILKSSLSQKNQNLDTDYSFHFKTISFGGM